VWDSGAFLFSNQTEGEIQKMGDSTGRIIRNQPFCWQEKKILRLFRKAFSGNELSKFRNLYLSLTEIDSDFNKKDIKYYTKTIATYSGLSPDWIPQALKTFEKMGVLEIEKVRESGKFSGQLIKFTPEKIKEIEILKYDSTDTVKPGNGESGTGKTVPGNPEYKKIIRLENNNYKENNNNIKGIENNSPQTLSFNLNESTSRNIIFKLKGIPELIQTIFHAHLGRPTKVLSQVDAFIRAIINKQFKYSEKDFDEKWFKNKGIVKALELILGITQGDEEAARRLIKKALLHFKKMKFDDKYWPNEDWIKRIQVDNFFYNPQTRKSWFLDCLVNPPVLTKEYLTLAKVNSIKENFSKIFEINSDDLAKNLYKYNRGYEKWEAPDWVTFFYTSKEIFQWWKDNRENLRLLNDSFHSYIGDSQQWLQVISEFLENVFPEPKPKFLNLQNGSWSVFENWMREERGIELKINQKEIDDKREYYKRLKDREIEDKIQERVNELAILIEEHDGVEPDFMELRAKVLEDMRKEGVEVSA